MEHERLMEWEFNRTEETEKLFHHATELALLKAEAERLKNTLGKELFRKLEKIDLKGQMQKNEIYEEAEKHGVVLNSKNDDVSLSFDDIDIQNPDKLKFYEKKDDSHGMVEFMKRFKT